VVLDARERHALTRVLAEDARDEIARLRGDVGREAEVDLDDAALGFRVPLRLKGRRAAEEFLREDAEGPVVHGVVVVLVLDHLGREVVERAAERRAARGGGMDGPAEIRDLEVAALADEEVLGLDVAVDDVLAVHLVERLGERCDVLRGKVVRGSGAGGGGGRWQRQSV
jgi:hypothetical protein